MQAPFKKVLKKNPNNNHPANQRLNCAKILTTYITNKRFTSLICKEHLKINKKYITSQKKKKMGKVCRRGNTNSF